MNDLTLLLPNGDEFPIWQNETVYERELHVNTNAPNASDDNDGSESSPFKSISAAARTATPKSRVLIHKGVYREFVRPSAGGDGIDSMISYEAYGDGDVIVKASVVAEKFQESTDWSLGNVPGSGIKIWSTEIDPEDYKGYNPFCAINLGSTINFVAP